MVKVPLCRFQQSLGPLAMLLWKRPFKRDFKDIYRITFFGDGNLGNTSAMRIIFFWKFSKFSLWALLPCFFWKRPFKRDFKDIYQITFFGDGNLGNPSAMRVIFFWKFSKFDVDFKNAEKNSEKVFCFWDNSIWVGCVKLSL